MVENHISMKQFYIFLSILVFILTCTITQVEAVAKESDSEGMLIIHEAVIDTRADRLESFLTRYNSPVRSYAHVFIEEADKNNLDWKFVASIAGLESTFCQHIPTGSYNCWGWGIPTGAQSGIEFDTFAHGVATVSKGLRQNYLNRGLITIEQIGHVYAASPTWAQRVRYFMTQLNSWNPQTDASDLPITI
jgi:hypothetical protein